MTSPGVFPLSCAVQQYAWGKPGGQSAVAQLSAAGNASFSINEDTTYAELWMGTHPKGPSYRVDSPETLSDYITQNPACVGEAVTQRFPTPGQLPFLFKVLSIQKALSIQAHPNKSHAEQLHKEKPDKYPDPNHKPEMAIALTPFEGLCGFRPTDEIVQYLKSVPELTAAVGSSLVDAFCKAANQEAAESSLRDCFTALMSCDQATVSTQADKLSKRISSMDTRTKSDVLGDLFERIHSQFPGDVGCFCIYLLNHMSLAPGEAMFLEANLPHAYISGDCIECMACSDNVVRAGLTPKFKDVPTLSSMLNYTSKTAAENLFPCQRDEDDPCLTVYNPPVPDFTVARMKVPAGTGSYKLPTLASASLLLVLSGSTSLMQHSLNIARGTVLFIAADEDVELNLLNTEEDLLMFRAYCQL